MDTTFYLFLVSGASGYSVTQPDPVLRPWEHCLMVQDPEQNHPPPKPADVHIHFLFSESDFLGQKI
jgi:hypothetical protein